jgi:ribonuclease HI
VVVSPSGVDIDLSIILEFASTNNQVNYESLLHGLEFLRDLGARDVDIVGAHKTSILCTNMSSKCIK